MCDVKGCMQRTCGLYVGTCALCDGRHIYGVCVGNILRNTQAVHHDDDEDGGRDDRQLTTYDDL